MYFTRTARLTMQQIGVMSDSRFEKVRYEFGIVRRFDRFGGPKYRMTVEKRMERTTQTQS